MLRGGLGYVLYYQYGNGCSNAVSIIVNALSEDSVNDRRKTGIIFLTMLSP